MLTAKNYRQLLQQPGRYRDELGEIKGLMLCVVNTNSASWQLRYQRGAKEHWAGLGSARLLSLREARIKARDIRLQLLAGVDPLQAKRAAKAQALAAHQRTMTFEAAAMAYHQHHQGKWKNQRHAAQFVSSMQQYVFPIFGAVPVSAITTALILQVLEQPTKAVNGKSAGRLWDTRFETANRLRRRIEGVWDWSRVRGYCEGNNPAAWEGNLKEVLPQPTAAANNWAALPYVEVAAFMATLRTHDSVVARALEFTVLCASRSGETLGARWDEITDNVWTIPAERMKSGKQHRVPLTDAAVALLQALPREPNNPYLFIGPRAGMGLPPASMNRFLKSQGHKDVTVHGFRSCFTDWAHEITSHDKVVIDMALAHAVSDKVEAAYRRGNLFSKRQRLMDDWARFCNSAPASDVVVALRR